MPKGSTIIIDSISKLEKTLRDGHLIREESTHKTVNVSFQLRVPRKMRAGEVKNYVNSAVAANQIEGAEITLYKQRVEVFMP